MTATADRMSLKNKHVRNGNYFAIIALSSHSILLANYATAGLDRSAVELNIEDERFTVACPRFC